MTAQINERLILDGQPAALACCPALPANHPRLLRKPENLINSSGCWRGYIGSWEIRDGRVYLVAIEGLYALTGDEPLAADWLNETFRIPTGGLLHYVHMDFMSIYEEELFVTVEKGCVTKILRVDNRGRSPEDSLPRPPPTA